MVSNVHAYTVPVSVKAGGMRVVTKHRHKDHDSDAYDEKYSDTVNAMAPPVKYVLYMFARKPIISVACITDWTLRTR